MHIVLFSVSVMLVKNDLLRLIFFYNVRMKITWLYWERHSFILNSLCLWNFLTFSKMQAIHVLLFLSINLPIWVYLNHTYTLTFSLKVYIFVFICLFKNGIIFKTLQPIDWKVTLFRFWIINRTRLHSIVVTILSSYWKVGVESRVTS